MVEGCARQQAVDRRFNRRRHDAAHMIAAFSARLRDELDLDTLSAELLAVAEQTMERSQGWLWLRPSHAPTSATGGHPAHQHEVVTKASRTPSGPTLRVVRHRAR